MADFGLAAQIGRGGGAGGMPQQQDPQNRMMQMMQLQQLQQNMMLAREQEMRQSQLFPLQREQVLTSTRADAARIPVSEAQARLETAKAGGAEDTLTAQRGVLDYIKNTPPEERVKPERLDTLRKTNPGAYTALIDQINATNVVKEKARAEEFSAQRAQFEMRSVALAGMSTLLPAITDQSKYDTLYQDYKVIDPTGAKIIGPEFTPQNVSALKARIQDLSDLEYKTDAFGREYTLNKRTGKTEMLAPPAPAPASAGAPAQMGVAPGAFAQPAMAAPDAARAAAGTPIIQPRVGAPDAAELGPKAVAKGQATIATKTAESAVDAEARKRNAKEVLAITSTPEIDKLIGRSTSGGLQRAAAGAYEFVTGQSTKGQEAIGQLETLANKLTLDMAGGKLGAGFSNEDRQFLLALLGDVANPNTGANRRIAAFRQFREGLKAIEGGKPLAVVPGSTAPTAASPDVDALLKKYQ